MRTIRAITILAVFVLMLTCTAGMVSAGVEPSPFQPQENEVLNMVNGLSVVHLQLDNVLTGRSGEAKGILKNRPEVVEGIGDYLDDLYLKLEGYLAALPDQEPRGRQAGIILAEGIFETSGIVDTVDDFIYDPEGEPDRELIAALLEVRLAAEEVKVLLVNAADEVMGVEPSPFKSDAGKLRAVVNNFESMEKRLDDTFSTQSDPYNPSTVNKLEAMNNEFETIQKRVDNMLSNSRVDPGQIQGSYIGAHEVGHSFLSFVDEYVEGGFENMQITQKLRELRAITLAIIDLLDPYIREG